MSSDHLFIRVFCFVECHLTLKEIGCQQEQLDEQDEGNAVFEFLMQGFMMPHFHSDPCSDAATQHGQSQKCCLRDSPLCLPCLGLVEAIDEESE